MTRFNYYTPAANRRFDLQTALWWDRQTATAAITIVTALALAASMWLVEARRGALLEGQLAALQFRSAAQAPAAERAQLLVAGVAKLRAQRDEFLAMRRETTKQTNTIALIGNRLPPQTWLNTLRATGVQWTLSGRSGRLTEIGTLLRTVQRLEPRGDARVVSITADGRHERMVDFVLAWDRTQ